MQDTSMEWCCASLYWNSSCTSSTLPWLSWAQEHEDDPNVSWQKTRFFPSAQLPHQLHQEFLVRQPLVFTHAWELQMNYVCLCSANVKEDEEQGACTLCHREMSWWWDPGKKDTLSGTLLIHSCQIWEPLRSAISVVYIKLVSGSQKTWLQQICHNIMCWPVSTAWLYTTVYL